MGQGHRIVWIDMEMSGLDPEVERILEIAVVVTDADLNVIAKGPEIVVHQSDEVLEKMDAWNTKHHGDSGLTEKVRSSTIDDADAERQVVDFLKKHCLEKKAPLAGNSIHQDRRFIAKYMPDLDNFLHYRLIDVSTLKELALRWFPIQYAGRPDKRGNHRAMADILESIEELQYYRKALFRGAKDE